MNFSILNLAKLGVASFLLTLSAGLQASQADIDLNAKQLNFNAHCNSTHHCSTHHCHSIPSDCGCGCDCDCEEEIESIPNSVFLSEELWRRNAIFLKDALQLIAFGSPGNEIFVVSNELVDNAQRINEFVKRLIFTGPNDVEFNLVQQNFTLYAYVAALTSNPSLVPQILENLAEDNRRLFQSLVEFLRTNNRDRHRLRQALAARLAALENVAKAWAEAVTTNNLNPVYRSFEQALKKSQEVGRIIGFADLRKD